MYLDTPLIRGCKDNSESVATQETDDTWDSQADDESVGTTTNNNISDQQGEIEGVETDFNKLHKEEVQEMLNSSDKAFDQYEILGHSWSRSNLRLKILEKRTGAELTVDAADAKIDCPHQLASYTINKKVGGKHSGRWKEWAKIHFKNMRRVFRRLERVYGIPSFSAAHDMGGALADNPGTQRRAKARRYRRMAKKPSRRNRRKANPMWGVQYGVRVPRNVKEAFELDRINKNTMWADSIKKEVDALMVRETFEFLSKSVRQLKGEGFHFAPLRMIFCCKTRWTQKESIGDWWTRVGQ